jgi:hypothetical protein
LDGVRRIRDQATGTTGKPIPLSGVDAEKQPESPVLNGKVAM